MGLDIKLWTPVGQSLKDLEKKQKIKLIQETARTGPCFC